jgi:hypothetical protein
MQALLEVAQQFTFEKVIERTPITLTRLQEMQHPNLLAENIEPVDESTEEPTVDLPVEETAEEREAKWLATLSTRILEVQAIWTGVYSGLYGTKTSKHGVPKPTEECFGEWIIDDVVGIRSFLSSLKTDLWSTSMKDTEFAWYSAGDLMFKNEDVCHFKMVAQDMKAYCETPVVSKKSKGNKLQRHADLDFIDEEVGVVPTEDVVYNCNSSKVMENVQSKAFNLITQVSGLMATFKQEDVDTIYAFNQFGRTLGQIFVEISGFKPTIEVA